MRTEDVYYKIIDNKNKVSEDFKIGILDNAKMLDKWFSQTEKELDRLDAIHSE